MSECGAGIRPFLNDTEVRCDRTEPHAMHGGEILDYAGAGSRTRVEWQEHDRRTFYGEWPGRCFIGGCVLPTGHHGEHAS